MAMKDCATNCFYELSTEVRGLPEPDAIVDAVRKYEYVVQYTLDGVEVLEAASYAGIPDGFLELRAFDEGGELHLLDVDGKLCGRVRYDVDGSGSLVFDEEHQLWGRVSSIEGDYIVLEESRGTLVRIPKSAVPEPDESASITIVVRNYLDEEAVDPESGDTRFAFSDYRFVRFEARVGE